MKAKSIMKRSTFTTRRKIIIYIIMSVLILCIAAGFTDPFITDNTKHVAEFGQTIVMESEPPETGDPSQYDAISNLKYAAYKLHHANFFRAVTDGTTSADLGITTYTQYVHNERVSNGNGIVFAETISSSSLKSVAEQKYADNGIIIFRPSTSINGSSATFSDTAYQMTYEDYGSKYGTVPDQLSKYIIDEETILSVVDENAKTKSAANAARTSADETEGSANGGSGFDFYVPEQLVPDAEGNYTFTLTLDPTKSSLYYRNEVRTLGGADQNPKFYAVSLTITIASDWTPISVTTIENYDIAIPVLGAMNCTGNLTEIFTDVGNAEGVVPEREFFQPYIDNAKNDPDYVPPEIPDAGRSPADYLATAFADYLSGERNLDLTVDLDAAGITAYDLALSLNIGTMDVQALLGDLYVKYSGDKVNIKLNGINGYLDTADFKTLMQNDKIGALLSGLGDLSSFDVSSLFGGDMLGTVFGSCEMTTEDGVTRIHLPFSLDISAFKLGEETTVAVDASIYINEEDMTLRSITGDIELFGKKISVEASPLATLPAFPSTEGAVDLSGVLDFLPDILTLSESKTFGLSGTVTALGQTLDISAYVDITDGVDKVKVDAMVSVMGADVSLKYVDGMVYVATGAIDARGTTDELTELASPLLNSAEAKKYLNLIKLMLPSTVNDALSAVKSLEVTPEKLTLGLNLLASPITVALERANGTITGLEFAVDFNMFGIRLNAAADLDITTPEAREIALPEGEEYISFAQLGAMIKQADPYLNAKAFGIALNGTVTATDTYAVEASANVNLSTEQTGIAANGAVSVLGQTLNLVYADDTAYVTLGNLKFKLNTNTIDEIVQPVMQLLGITKLPELNVDEIVPQALAAIKSLTVADDGKLIAVVQMQGVDITAVIDLKTGSIKVTGTAAGIRLNLDITVTPLDEQVQIAVPNDASAYIDCVELVPTIQAVAGILETKSISTNIAFEMDDIAESARLELSFADGLKARLTHAALGLEVSVIGQTAYVALGDIRVVGTLSDIPALLEAVDPILPAQVKQQIADAMQMLENIPSAQSIADIALNAITSLTVDNAHTLHATVTYNDIAVIASIATDLSTVTADVTAGNRIIATLSGISSEEVTVTAPTDSFATLANLTNVVKSVLPLATEKAFEIALNDINVLGVSISGKVYIGIENGFALDADLTVADLPVRAVIAESTLYLTVNGLRISEGLSKDSLSALANELETYIPGISNMLADLGNLNISITNLLQTVLDDVALFAHGANGIAVNVTHADSVAVTVNVDTADGILSAVSANGTLLGNAVNMVINVATANGVVTGLACENASVAETTAAFDIGVSGAQSKAVQPIADCINATTTLTAVSQIGEVALAAANGNGIALDFGTTAITLGETDMTVSGNAEVSVTPLAAQATVTATIGQDSYTIDVVYENGLVYVAYNGIKLKLDPMSDVLPLYELIKDFLPDNITDMVEIALGNKQGSTPFDAILDIVNRIKPIVAQPTVQNILSTLLSYDEDNASLAKTVFGMIELEKLGSTFTLGVSTDDMLLKVTPNGNTVSVRVNAMGISTSVTLSNIVSQSVTVGAPTDGNSYAELSAVTAAARPIIPLVNNKAFALDINCTLFNTPITGTGYLDISDGVAMDVSLLVGDINVEIRIVDGTLYLAVDESIKISEALTLDNVKALVAQLDKLLPGIEEIVNSLIDSIMNMTVQELLGLVELTAADANSFTASLDLTESIDITAAITLTTDGSTLTSLGIDAALFGKEVELTLNAAKDELGTLASLGCNKTDILGVDIGIGIGIAGTEVRTTPVAPISNCIALEKLTEYIDPVLSLVKDANGVDTITLDLGAFALFDDNSQIKVSGKVKIEFVEVPELDKDGKPVKDENEKIVTTTETRVEIALKLFDETDSVTELNVIYIDDTVYIQLGTILLSLNTANDFERLYYILAEYLPDYINIELAKLFNLTDVLEELGAQNSASAFSELSLIIERFIEIAEAETAEETIDLLFKKLEGFSSNSALKAILKMIRVIDGDEISIEAEVMGIVLNVTPHITNAKLSSVTVKTSVMGVALQAQVNKFALLAAPEQTTDAQTVDSISAPGNADDYLSVMEFAELINDAVHTFTTTNANGDITFEVKSFTYDYTIYKVETQKDAEGNDLLDEDGNPIPVKENGRNKPLYDANTKKKVVDTKIDITTPADADAALKGKFIKSGDTYLFNLEAHIEVAIDTFTKTSPIRLDLYVKNETGNGMALLDYMEGGNNNGERIFIDYESIMQMVAAVMRILDVDPNVVNDLIDEKYMVDINTDVFGSMDINGLGDIKEMIDDIAKAVQKIVGTGDEDQNTESGALDDIKSAWKLFYSAGDHDIAVVDNKGEEVTIKKGIDVLKYRLEDVKDKDGNVTAKGIKSYIKDALSKVQGAIDLFGGNKTTTPNAGNETPKVQIQSDEPTENEESEITLVDGKVFHDIVTGVSFGKTEGKTDEDEGKTVTTISANVSNEITTGTTVGNTEPATVSVAKTQGEDDRYTIDRIIVKRLDVNTALLNEFDMQFTAGKEVSIDLPDNYESNVPSGMTYSNLANIKHLIFDVMNTANMLEFEIGDLNNDTTNNIAVNISLAGLDLISITIKYSAKIRIIEQPAGSDVTYKTAAVIDLVYDKVMDVLPAGSSQLIFYDNVIYIKGMEWLIEEWDTKFLGMPIHHHKPYTQPVQVAYTVQQLGDMLKSDDGLEKFMREFLFYLLPLNIDCIFHAQDVSKNTCGGINVQEKIIEAAKNTKFTDAYRTTAQVFKGYEYTDGQHHLEIGLGELTGVPKTFYDLTVYITGANDGANGEDDDTLLDNYISSLKISTKFTSMVELSVNGTLRNVPETIAADGLKSVGLTKTYDDHTLEEILSDVVVNTEWSYIWA